MSTSAPLGRGRRQIAVRLPDELVTFVDDAVGDGRATSRAGLIEQALKRERRRIIAEQDIVRLQAHRHPAEDEFADLDDLADHIAATPLTDLD
ncbi:MAG: YlcI/YnfO family protein [Thermocrispum sp.]